MIYINPLSDSTYLILLALHDESSHDYWIIKGIENTSEGTYIIAPLIEFSIINKGSNQLLWIETILALFIFPLPETHSPRHYTDRLHKYHE